MFIDKKQLKFPVDYENKMKLLRFLPTMRIVHVATCLIIKHKDDFYLVKIRPSHEFKIDTEDFTIIKKGDILGYDVNLNHFIGECIVFDITGCHLENVCCTNFVDIENAFEE